MNYLAQMLSTGPTLKSSHKPPRTWLYTPEMVARQRATRIRNSQARYRDALIKFPDRKATTKQLADVMDQTPSAMAHTLKAYSTQENTPIILAGTLPTKGNGRDQHVWQWVGE